MRYLDGSAQPYTEMAVPQSARTDGLDKFRRYRTTQRARGMKLLRVWVPDPRASGFREEAHRQALLLKGAPEEREALEFIEAAANTDDDAA
ncbi:MAG: antitoxin MazE family protein [Acetobacteraceae bacterium]